MKVGLFELIARARRRLLRNELAIAGARAANAGMAAFVLLLVAGTDILNWRWLAAISIPTLVAGAIVGLRRRPSAYRMAQLLDTRLHLADTLSTAVYYATLQPPRRCDEATRIFQRERATQLAGTVDLRRVLPVRIPHAMRISLAALTVAAAGLVLLRYGTEDHLELHQPLAVISRWAQQARTEIAQIERNLRGTARHRSETGVEDSKSDGSEKADADSQATAESEKARASGNDEPAEGREEQGSNQGRGEKQSAGVQQSSGEASAMPADSSADQQGNQAANQNGSQSGNSSSLLSRLSDSLANLASLMKSNPQAGADSGKDPASGKGREKADGGRKGMPSRGESSGATPQAGDQAGDSSMQDGAANGMSAASAKTDQREGSGAGREDGRKEIEAEKQLEAMGKISVILGKRSQDLSGMATIEVTSGRTELRTKYEPRDASHGSVEASAERDRIPIEFESYVQQYFRELRRPNNPATRKK